MSSQVVGAANGGSAPLSNNNPEPDDGKNKASAELPVAEKPSATSGIRQTGGGTTISKAAGNQECQFFFEDEVFRIDRRGRVRFGVITETSESYSSDEEDDIDHALAKGEVRVAFYPDGKEIVQEEHLIGLADRTLMPGDVVRRKLPGQKDLTGQAGYVRDVSMRADVKVLGTQYVIRNVPSERLRQISEWARDVPVCFGTWIGTILTVDESAVLKTANGMRLEITSNDFYKFKDFYEPCTREVFSPNVYYPGNVVIGRLPPIDRVKNLTPEITVPVYRKGRSVYIVESVKTTAVTVAWTCKAISQGDKNAETDPLKHPKTCIKGEDLPNVKRLNLYESYMLQIHDRFYLRFTRCDKLVKIADWEDEQAIIYQAILIRHQNEQSKPVDNFEASPSAPSSSRVVRNVAKFRRVLKTSSQRLHRALAEVESSNLSTTSVMKVHSRSANIDETWDSIDDEDDDDEPHETQDAQDTSGVMNEAPTTASNASAAQTTRFSSRHAKRRHMKKKMRSGKKSISSPFPKKDGEPKDGDDLVVETLVVYSSVTVVWQDGSVESGIPSTQLYPIHHLDNHEFFPGDFVSKSNDSSPSQTDYGVIQSVDHDERIAKVKWFNIYGNMDNPVPTFKDMEELSVYDLKDHADYQYRPGTMVIRVSNFSGEDLNSTAGQVIDNFPDGRVRVWWAQGHITMCYPQDLFEISHSDQEQDGFESDASDDSWETQSENSRIGPNMSSTSIENDEYILAGIDSAKKAMKRLEKVFRVLPPRRKSDVLNDLMAVYKNCRHLDHLLHTNFFHEDNFQGIVRRNECTNSSAAFCIDVPTNSETLPPSSAGPAVLVNATLKLPEATAAAQSVSTPTKRKSSTDVHEVQCKKSNDLISESSQSEVDLEDDELLLLADKVSLSPSETQLNYDQLINKFRSEYTEMLHTARSSIAKAFEKRKHCKHDSGVCSRGENSTSDLTFGESKAEEEKDDLKCVSDASIELAASRNADVCEIFYFLINEQMDKCRTVVVSLYKYKKKSKANQSDELEIEEAVEATEQMQYSGTDNADTTKVQPLNLNVLSESLPPLDSPVACSSPSDSFTALLSSDVTPSSEHCFEVLPNAPDGHHFINNNMTPTNRSQYQRAVQREYRMLQASLPSGVYVRVYEDRMDLMSVMMVGPKRTPYQNALFFFDFQMGREYPKSPPSCHYISYCTDRLNPNLYEEGKVCVSLLGTWAGRDTEVWTPKSTMLQVLVSIQGLILVDEPYYNEAGYEKQRGTQLGNENSRVYNEMAIIKIAHSTVKQLQNPPLIFRSNVLEHFKQHGNELHGRMQGWSDFSAEAQRLRIGAVKDMPEEHAAKCELPDFPLLPCSRGFCIAVKVVLDALKLELNALSPQPETNTAPRAAPEEV